MQSGHKWLDRLEIGTVICHKQDKAEVYVIRKNGGNTHKCITHMLDSLNPDSEIRSYYNPEKDKDDLSYFNTDDFEVIFVHRGKDLRYFVVYQEVSRHHPQPLVWNEIIKEHPVKFIQKKNAKGRESEENRDIKYFCLLSYNVLDECLDTNERNISNFNEQFSCQ